MSASLSDVRVIRVMDVPRQRWRNGGGWTRELLATPNAQTWRVRISVADIESDGPFSSFPGVERWFTVIVGKGVALTIDNAMHRLTPADAPLRFNGEASADCRLIDGPTRDLNLMLRDARGSMARVVAGERWSPQARACGLFATVAGRCHADGVPMDVPAEALLWFEHAPTTLAFDAAQRSGEDPIGWWLAAAPGERVK
jgi:environmental stress-induced protein Ves